MKRGLILLAVGVLSVVGAAASPAAPFTLNFSEVLGLNDPEGVGLVGDEFAAFGITTIGAYLYRDSYNDPFGDGSYGLSVDFTQDEGNVAVICFEDATPYLSVDWAIAHGSEADMELVALDGSLNLLDTRHHDYSEGSGTDDFSGLSDDIKYLAFFDDQYGVGAVAASTLTYERPAAPIPEPASFLLLGLGGLGVLALRRRRTA